MFETQNSQAALLHKTKLRAGMQISKTITSYLITDTAPFLLPKYLE